MHNRVDLPSEKGAVKKNLHQQPQKTFFVAVGANFFHRPLFWAWDDGMVWKAILIWCLWVIEAFLLGQSPQPSASIRVSNLLLTNCYKKGISTKRLNSDLEALLRRTFSNARSTSLAFVNRATENEEEGWPPSQKQCSIRASSRAFNYAQGKMDTETNFVVTVGFTTKVDHQTTSKISLVVKPTVTTKFVSVSILPCA